MSTETVKVMVRIRPMNAKEKARGNIDSSPNRLQELHKSREEDETTSASSNLMTVPFLLRGLHMTLYTMWTPLKNRCTTRAHFLSLSQSSKGTTARCLHMGRPVAERHTP